MLRILLINDTARKVGRLKNALSEAGFEVLDESGLTVDLPARVAALRPDVILIDSESPGRDVLEQVCLVSRDQPRPIVMFTDEHDPKVMRQAIQSGVSAYIVEGIQAQRLRLNPGVETLIQACKQAGLKILLVSGGFTFFTERIRQRLGIDFTRANLLEITDGKLTGRMVDQAWGDICDGAEKARTLLEVATLMGIPPEQTIAMGDGANDLKMMGVAGLSVAYHAKPAVRNQAMVAINEGGLDRLLEVLG